MPYNKKNSENKNHQGNSFDKKGSNNHRPYNPDGAGKRKEGNAPDAGRRNEKRPYDQTDRSELAPPRFLAPRGDRPFPAKRDDSRPYSHDKKRADGGFNKDRPADRREGGYNKSKPVSSGWDKNRPDEKREGGYNKSKPTGSGWDKNRPDDRRAGGYNKSKPTGSGWDKERSGDKREGGYNKNKPAGNAWDKNDLAQPKYFESGDRKPYRDNTSGDKKHYDKSESAFRGRGAKPDSGGKDSFKPWKDRDGDDRKTYKPKYETEVKGKKSYNDKPVKTPNERKNELLGTKDEPTDIRLNKYIANSGICARREADDLIRKGMVTVNGVVVTEMGHKVKKADVVKFEGKIILPEPFVYILMNKPKDFITTTDDEKGRKTVMDLLADKIPQRIYPIGRLDRNTTGVLLLTNDGEVAQALTHPTFEIKKLYHVVLDKKVSSTDLDKLVEGVTLEDGLVFADSVSFVDKEDKRHVGVEIHSGKNRVVRRMFEHLGYEVEKLDRVSVGVFTKKDLPRGKWRYLSQAEVGFLMKLKSKMP